MRQRFPGVTGKRLERLIEATSDSWRDQDKVFKGFVGDNQWYLAQATAFGLKALEQK